MVIFIKENTFEYKKWNVKRCKKMLKRRTKRKIKLKNLKKDFNYLPKYKKFGMRTLCKIFKAPKNFSIEENVEETFKFFEEIFKYIRSNPSNTNNKTIYVDSSEVLKVSESTLMYLYAVINDVKFSNYDISGNHPKNPDVKELYRRIGFNRLLRRRKVEQKEYDGGNVLIYRGDSVNPALTATACKFITSKSDIKKAEIYGPVIELMGNTVQHAYSDYEKLEKKWQIFVKNDKEGINFIFLDTGKGIPGTVRKNKLELLKKVFPTVLNYNESEILKSAFEGKFRTRTNLENRGKGLPQIHELMLSKSITQAAVYSGKSMCKIINNKEFYSNLPVEFYGTLYEFTILRSVGDEIY